MSFKNQYTPELSSPLSSRLLTEARASLRLGHSKFDMWTVDYDREMVLVHSGSGHELESANEVYWDFMDCKGHYRFTTEEVSRLALIDCPVGNETLRTATEFWGFVRCNRGNLNRATVEVVYKLRYFLRDGETSLPDGLSLLSIKEALGERARRHLFDLEAFSGGRVTLLDRNGEEL